MPSPLHQASATLRAFALGLPGAKEEHPWGETVAKVNKKIFVFFGSAEDKGKVHFGVKLPESHRYALTLPYTKPAGYGLGKSGWVDVRYDLREAPPVELFLEWIEESYRTIATKKLVARLDAPRDESEVAKEKPAAPKGKKK